MAMLVTFNQLKTKTEKARFPITTWFGNVSVNFVDSHKHLVKELGF